MQELYHERLQKIRIILHSAQADAFVISVNDEFFSEYPPEHYNRLEWLTGFNGSAGTAIVMQNTAAFFTDGRYTLQAPSQVNTEYYQHFNSGETSPLQWLMQHNAAMNIVIDPWLFSVSQMKKWREKLPQVVWNFLPQNPIDSVWENRPALNTQPAFDYPLVYAGKSSEEKRTALASQLKASGVDAVFITVPESVCWLLNLRGCDVAHTPVLLCRALVDATGEYQLFAEGDKLANTQHRKVAVLEESCAKLAGKRILIDPSQTPVALAEMLTQAGALLVEGEDPCILPKACKNEVELQNIRDTHVVDGLALSRFLQWVDGAQILGEGLLGEGLNEISASQKLEAFRRENTNLLDLSFPTISGFAENGAIVHYRATPESSKPFTGNSLYLVDSGGQYWGGTTDVTRTLAYGESTQEMRRHFTLVLKGHIALARAVFPKGTTGRQLDALARQYLWQAGLDYDHGTGHGVGCCLGVHEGPQRISKMGSDTPLQTGMIISNEPGYYRTGHYGIRLENLVEVVAAETTGFMRFNTLTCAPFDRRLVLKELLTADETQWWNDYHVWVLHTHLPKWQGDAAWLKSACAAL